MHLTACVKGAIESTVESMGSKLEHSNMEGRRITTEHLNEEVFVAWSGPEIQHCDVLRGTLNRYFGAWQGVTLHHNFTSSWLNSENASKVFNDERLDIVCSSVKGKNVSTVSPRYPLWNVQVLTVWYWNIYQYCSILGFGILWSRKWQNCCPVANNTWALIC